MPIDASNLPPEVKRELKQVGREGRIAKLASNREGEDFDRATGWHKARSVPRNVTAVKGTEE
jgi:hypothetical protein